MPKKAGAPMKNDYRPETDVTPELNTKDAAYYQLLSAFYVGLSSLVVRYLCEVSMMSSCLALPREGHLQVLFYFSLT